MEHEVGSLVEGRVVDVVKFGAFVKIRGGKTGLVHISQISDKFVREVSDYITVGSEVIAKIISVDEKGRVQLSIKDVTPDELERFNKSQEDKIEKVPGQRDYPAPPPGREYERRDDDSFEAKMKRFMRQSEDRLTDLKRNKEGKRGGGGKRRK